MKSVVLEFREKLLLYHKHTRIAISDILWATEVLCEMFGNCVKDLNHLLWIIQQYFKTEWSKIMQALHEWKCLSQSRRGHGRIWRWWVGVERGSRRTFRGTGKDRNVKRWKLTAAEMHVHTVAFYVFWHVTYSGNQIADGMTASVNSFGGQAHPW